MTIHTRMALLYPILASIVLLGLFYFYSYVQNIMLLYVVICSVVCVGVCFQPFSL